MGCNLRAGMNLVCPTDSEQYVDLGVPVAVSSRLKFRGQEISLFSGPFKVANEVYNPIKLSIDNNS